MIHPYHPKDFFSILELINNAAQAYKGIIPADRWHDPYMTEEDLIRQMAQGVQFWCYHDQEQIAGVMGIQDKKVVTLIRHAYVLTTHQQRGIGSQLLQHLSTLTTLPVLIGTWASAKWAIQFYQKHGFRLLTVKEKDMVLRQYWNIPERQVETSVVLANEKWKKIV